MKDRQIRQLELQILSLKLESPYHPDIKRLQLQLDELYARQSSEQA